MRRRKRSLISPGDLSLACARVTVLGVCVWLRDFVLLWCKPVAIALDCKRPAQDKVGVAGGSGYTVCSQRQICIGHSM